MDAFIRFTCFSFPAGVICSACLFSPDSGHVPHVHPWCPREQAHVPWVRCLPPLFLCTWHCAVLPSFDCGPLPRVSSSFPPLNSPFPPDSVGSFVCSWHVHSCAHSTVLEVLVSLLIRSPRALISSAENVIALRPPIASGPHCRPWLPPLQPLKCCTSLWSFLLFRDQHTFF